MKRSQNIFYCSLLLSMDVQVEAIKNLPHYLLFYIMICEVDTIFSCDTFIYF